MLFLINCCPFAINVRRWNEFINTQTEKSDAKREKGRVIVVVICFHSSQWNVQLCNCAHAITPFTLYFVGPTHRILLHIYNIENSFEMHRHFAQCCFGALPLSLIESSELHFDPCPCVLRADPIDPNGTLQMVGAQSNEILWYND